jgi:putative FmdB family regulatory protein
MPLYPYHCKACEAEFEMLVRASDSPACPSCGSADLQQLVCLPVKEGKSKALKQAWRARAQREGDLSNFSKKEVNTIKS